MAKKRTKKKVKMPKGVKIALLSLLALIMLTGAIVGGIVVGALAGVIGNTDLSAIENIRGSLSLNLTSFIYTVDADGTERQLEVLYDEENRVWADLEEIPENLQNAFI
ncbi:MAG: hypothetical protein IJ297_02450, partial [Clostridia bacterium]|nr:hypothetical protein [Clostridia bacterium]